GVLIWLQMGRWTEDVDNPFWIYASVGPVAILLAGFLGWLAIYPTWASRREEPTAPMAPALTGVHYRRIGVAVEFAGADDAVLAPAAALARSHGAELPVVHVVEGLSAAYYGEDSRGLESREDHLRMDQLAEHLRDEGLLVQGLLGYGDPPEELV